jgi:hypothetical protein
MISLTVDFSFLLLYKLLLTVLKMSKITFVAIMVFFILNRPVYPTVTVGMDASLMNYGYNSFIEFKTNNSIKRVQYGQFSVTEYSLDYFPGFAKTDTHLTHASIMIGSLEQSKNNESSIMIGIGTIYGKIEDKTKKVQSCILLCRNTYETIPYSSPMITIEARNTTRYFSFLDLGYGGRIIFAFKDALTFLDLYISLGLSFWD